MSTGDEATGTGRLHKRTHIEMVSVLLEGLDPGAVEFVGAVIDGWEELFSDRRGSHGLP